MTSRTGRLSQAAFFIPAKGLVTASLSQLPLEKRALAATADERRGAEQRSPVIRHALFIQQQIPAARRRQQIGRRVSDQAQDLRCRRLPLPGLLKSEGKLCGFRFRTGGTGDAHGLRRIALSRYRRVAWRTIRSRRLERLRIAFPSLRTSHCIGSNQQWEMGDRRPVGWFICKCKCLFFRTGTPPQRRGMSVADGRLHQRIHASQQTISLLRTFVGAVEPHRWRIDVARGTEQAPRFKNPAICAMQAKIQAQQQFLRGFLMKPFALATCLYLLVSVPSALGEGMHFDFNWQIRIGCDGPTVAFPIRNWPAEVNGKASLLPDKSTSMEVSMSGLGIPTGVLRWNGRLGGRPVSTPGGTAELRVAGPNSLRATWRQPHNDIFMDLVADQQSCKVSVDIKLHPGQTFYTLYNGRNYENCPEIRIVQATCKAY